MNNSTIATYLRQRARELDADKGNLLRVRAYRRAAQTILESEEPVTSLYRHGGRRALQNIPDVGRHIAAAIEALLNTGRIPVRPKTPAA